MEYCDILAVLGPRLNVETLNPYASFLVQQVFTDMSVLPLVFPSNTSCHPGGSLAEELAKRRELPVPPLPRKGGVLAKSEDNITGQLMIHELTNLPLVKRQLSCMWLEGEIEGDTMSVNRVISKDVEGRTFSELWVSDMRSDVGEHCMNEDPAGQSESSSERGAAIEDSQKSDTGSSDIIQKACDERDYGNKGVTETDGSKDLSQKMNVFKESEKTSLLRSTIDRLSLRLRKKKKESNKVKVEKTDNIKPKTNTNTESIGVLQSVNTPDFETEEIDRESPALDKVTSSNIEDSLSNLPENYSPLPPPRCTPSPLPPSSCTPSQSRPISELGPALKSFKLAAAKSRESLVSSRLDISVALKKESMRPVVSKCPVTPSATWRQKPPPTNSLLDSEWRRLSSSMMELSQARKIQPQEETSLDEAASCISSTNQLVIKESINVAEQVVETPTVVRAQSVSVLNTVEVPRNKLKEMNPYQRRVQASLEKLDGASWYKPSNTSTLRRNTLAVGSGARSETGQSSWRRHVSPSPSSSAYSTLDRRSTLLSSDRHKARMRSVSNSISSSSLSSSESSNKQVYTGWRNQAKLGSGPSFLLAGLPKAIEKQDIAENNEVEREAYVDSIKAKWNTKEIHEESIETNDGIKQVTEAIVEFCSTSVSETTDNKESWPPVNDQADTSSDTCDDDSGIDRSDDFTQEILGEA